MDTGIAIETRGLRKRFGAVEAVSGIDLRVEAGGVFGFLGPNGAGKTTTIRMLVALLRPTRGEVSLFGEPVRPGASVLAQVGALVERPAFYPYLSAATNLRLLAAARGSSSAEAARLIGPALDRAGLGPVAGRKVGGFSTGMRQRLGLALAMLHRPRLIILDEPTNGLDPGGVVEVRAIIGELTHDGTTVFLSSHVLSEVEQLCERVAILRHGRVVADGATKDLLGGEGRLFIRFDTPAESDAARRVLGSAGVIVQPADEDPLLGSLVAAAAADASGLARRLGEAGLYPAELTVRRPTLESVFLELTRDEEPGDEQASRDEGARP
jgi:ABC-2 type transport system ATP-binding protein